MPSNSRQHAARRFQQQVQRVFHPAIQTVQTLHAVVHGMQFPQKVITVAQVMHERDAAVGDDDGQQQLQPEWQLDWPERPQRQMASQQGKSSQARQVQRLVDERVQHVAPAVAVRMVPCAIVWQIAFGKKRGEQSQQQQGRQDPEGVLTNRNQAGGGADEAGPEVGVVQRGKEGFHGKTRLWHKPQHGWSPCRAA